MNLRVVKLGGSLFDLPDLGRRVEVWLAQQTPMPTAFIAGGGMFADAVRRFDAIQQLPSPAAHLLALRSMELGSQALAALLPTLDLVREADPLRRVLASAAQGTCCDSYVGVWNVIDYWLDEVEPTLSSNSLDWTLTSDSISATLAQHWQAASLVLLKSCERPGETADDWTQAGAVDSQFAAAALGVNVTWANLRG
ncbi:hypothetical protein [Blastopirellula marina]|uniref:Amino acid kinase family protein n=1 Tax=Blastopirellula marina DSM 3645 TaxID=314230 RepID=A4A0U7_9BACT|nr:hypothetical protein [Blastopirellula marina]EAQ77604.1 amino acid kinase family protein [Blastopirellula marina DSM 3645]